MEAVGRIGTGTLLAVACGTAPAAPKEAPIIVSPDSVTVYQGESQAFSVSWAAKRNPNVIWSVLPSPDAGSVVDGFYTAPVTPGTFQVVAASASDPSNRAEATVTVPPITVGVFPGKASVGVGAALFFRTIVDGTHDSTVSWSLAPQSSAAVDQSGLFTAGLRGGTFVVSAASNRNPTVRGTAAATVVEALDGGGPLSDNGGRVLSTSRTYAVWWGTPDGFPVDAQGAIESLLRGLADSHYLRITEQYLRGDSISDVFMGSLHDPVSSPATVRPTQTEVANEICKMIQLAGITPTPADVYIVYSSTPFDSDSRGGAPCGWHGIARCQGVQTQMAYVASPSGSGGICAGANHGCNSLTAGTTLMGRATGHELAEAITSATGYVWVDATGLEIADKCGPYAACVPVGTDVFELEPLYSNAAAGCVAGR